MKKNVVIDGRACNRACLLTVNMFQENEGKIWCDGLSSIVLYQNVYKISFFVHCDLLHLCEIINISLYLHISIIIHYLYCECRVSVEILIEFARTFVCTQWREFYQRLIYSIDVYLSMSAWLKFHGEEWTAYNLTNYINIDQFILLSLMLLTIIMLTIK